ncbi:mannose-ethanolamine phosphotransferase gpi13 [Tilletia horrida]|uniref:Mannose-ethanolamine phosphotransferase gpi13 n=1 Tax=Tilletia horrida TaxID=155126 RepID=A0AAN6GY13_9BASI|nr:mannose-ethanolamine phosphotransferase gpi13 [Tilletia horrida]
MPSALLPARDIRLPPPEPQQGPPGGGHHNHHDHHHEHEHANEHDSHSDDDGESHSSHSSYQRRHAPPDAPPPPTSIGPPTLAALSLIFLLLLYHLFGLALFTRGFLLTRRQLDGIRSESCTTPASASYIPTPPPGYGDGAELDPHWSALGSSGSSGQLAECALPASHTFDRAVVLIVDALRYDFLAPINDTKKGGGDSSSNAEWQPHPYQHGHLSLPAELLAAHPSHSFLSHFYADPPTTTLQRIKGLTTGTLPTFVDASANFGGGQRIEEDNWIDQLLLRARASKVGAGKVIFAGDDTWMGLFPNTFHRATPFDSFNVHDLDTVDRGVRRVLDPYLRQNGSSSSGSGAAEEAWRLLLLHNLGLDHAGHRFSSTHPSIKRKLLETNELVGDIINHLAGAPQAAGAAAQPRTLFVLLGDHGMDPQGDHGGDAELEVGAGLFMWSGGGGHDPVTFASESHPDIQHLLSPSSNSLIPPARLPFSTLGPSSLTHRSIAQIDLVPSLSLLLGLPIPFNSLGTVVPELFAGPASSSSSPASDPGTDLLLRALRLNAYQIRRYFKAYSSRGGSPDSQSGEDQEDKQDMSTSEGLGGELESEIDRLWAEARRADARFAFLASSSSSSSPPSHKAEVDEARRAASKAYFSYTRASLTHARSVWATFDIESMLKGLALLIVGLGALVSIVLGELGREERVGVVGDGLALVSEDEKDQKEQPGMVRVSRRVWRKASRAFVVGAGVSLPVWTALASVRGPGLLQRGWNVLESTIFTGALLSGLSLALGPSTSTLFPRSAPASFKTRYQALSKTVSPSRSTALLIGPALVHAALFASNSTILREDFIVLLGLGAILLGMFLSLAGRLPRPVSAATTSTAQSANAEEGGLRMSRRAFVLVKAAVLVLVILACARMGRYGSLCREEHGPTCVSNFYASVPRPQASPSSAGAAGGIKFGDSGGSGAAVLQSSAGEEEEQEQEQVHVLAPHMSVAGGLAAVAEGGATNSIPSILFAYLCALFLPSILQTLLTYARFSGERSAALGGNSNVGVAPRFLSWVVRPALLAGAGHWAADRLAGDAGSSAAAAAAAKVGAEAAAASETSSTAEWAAFGAIFVGRCAVGFLVVATLFWLLAPLCIELRQVDAPVSAPAAGASQQQQQQQQRKQVQLLGFGNVFGSTYLLLVSVVFGALFLTAQPSGQVTLAFSFVALVLLAELSAELRSASASASADATSKRGSTSPASSAAEIWSSHAVALLAHNAFFGTGHQATLSAIQWRTAFILTRVVTYPWSPVLVVLNALGPLVLLPAVGVGLVGVLWGLSPKAPVLPPPTPGDGEEDDEAATSAADLASNKAEQERKRKIASAHMYTLLHLTRTILILALYFQTLTLGSAVWSTQMRRHLMLYKVWTPRFMLAAMAGVGRDWQRKKEIMSRTIAAS